ncbi:hypothetical protein Q9189_007705 [Teloschistes chrysophthalmus]
MKFASAVVAVSTLGSLVLAAPAPVAFNESDVEVVKRNGDYTKGRGYTNLKFVTYVDQNCQGFQNFADSLQWGQNQASDSFKSYYLTRDLKPNEVLDFSGKAGRRIRRDDVIEVAESSPREESPLEKREINPACVVFLQHAQGDGRKAGCRNTPVQTISREGFYMMLLPRLSLHSYLLLAFTILSDAHTLTLTVPSSTPLLPASTRAHLTTQALTLTAPITTKNNFVFRNLTKPGSYNLDVYCRDWDIEPALVILQPGDGQKVEVFRRKPTGGKGARLGGSEAGEGGRVELRVRGRREYYEAREGSNEQYPVDPEMRKEFEEQQQKSVLGNAAGGGNPLQSFDMAGWMAGQSTGKAVETSGRDKGEASGTTSGSSGKGGGGQGKRRRG